MFKNIGGLTAEESEIFIELFESSLRINQREQFFSWLQGTFQYLFPHEVLLCGIRPENQDQLHFESFISTRYVTKEHIQQAIQDEESLIQRSISHWQRFQRPVFIAESLTEGDFGVYKVPFCLEQGVLQQIELKNVAAHGLASKDGEVITFFSFSRVPEPLNSKHAYVLELIVPHLHAVLMRIVGGLNGQGLPGKLRKGKSAKHAITEREREVLKWMQAGKTNSEIAAILKISTMTVKNHVHNILKKLGVENRNNACAKASQLGLFNV